MNKKYLIIIPIIAIAILALTTLGLDQTDFDIIGNFVNPIPITVNYAPIPKDIAQANNKFAIDFYKQISDNTNVFYSPTSMYVAFSLLYEGAQNNTATQMQEVFGFEPDDFVRHNSTAHLISSINQDDPHTTLDLANALWIADWFEPYDEYLDIARQTYIATVETLDFGGSPEDSVKTINDWASEKTNEKIKKVIDVKDVNAETAMVINNAIYFKGTWFSQFAEEDTKESVFRQNSTSNVNADFMNQRSMFDYTRSGGAQVLKMPYEGDRLSMLVILPDDNIENLEDMISAEQIQSWNDYLLNQEVVVSIPKFEMKTNYKLNKPLIDLGMPDVFNDGAADLSGLVIPNIEGSPYVSTATQDAYVKVNEEGTEAAAVTAIVVMTESMPPPPPQFIADHPFLFIIQDDSSGAILFMGKLYDPTPL